MSAPYPELPDGLTEQELRIFELLYQEHGIDLHLFAIRLQSTFATILSGSYFIKDILDDGEHVSDADIDLVHVISEVISDVAGEWHDISQQLSEYEGRRKDSE